MQYTTTLILALTTTISALDIRLFTTNDGCQGAYAACVNINPTTCCSHNSGARYPSIDFVAIPRSWNIQVRGWTGGSCGALAVSGHAQGVTGYCLSDPNPVSNIAFSGGGYKFLSKRRSRTPEPSEQCAVEEASPCESTVKPNLFVLADSTEYDIADMPEPLLETLVRIYSRLRCC